MSANETNTFESPTYSNPPVVEVAISVQFSTSSPVDTTKLVLFWDREFRSDYPKVSSMPVIEDVFEKFDDFYRPYQHGFQLQLEPIPGIRYQFINSSGDRMIQMQPTRIVMNWMKQKQNYPRFSVLFREFINFVKKWEQYASETGSDLGTVVPNQWELVYVNLIRKGELWQTTTDWHNVSTLFHSETTSIQDGLQLEDRGFHWRMRMPDILGRIHLTAKQVVVDEENAIQLGILARGPTENFSEVGVHLQTAHAEIKKLFEKIITEKAKATWGLK